MTPRYNARPFLFPILALALSACAGTPDAEAPQPVEAAVPLELARPFTRAFLSADVLVASEITIEGPEDLIQHVALRQEPGVFIYDTKTTNRGLRQTISKKRSAPVAATIRAQLDNWSLVADRKMIVLQRPGDCPVVVRANGKAVYLPVGGQGERREATLEFRGLHGQ